METCVECSKQNCLLFDESEGNIVCTECGRVNSFKIIDESAEWRDFEDNEGRDPRRVGMPNNDLLGDRGLGTTISESSLKKWGQRSQRSSSDSALIKSFIEFDQLSTSINLPASITEKCKKLFKKVYSTKSTKGKSHKAIICACIFVTCRKYKNPCNLQELVRECAVDKAKLIKAYELVKDQSRKLFPLSLGQKLAVEIAEKIEMGSEDVEKVLNLFEEIEDSDLVKQEDRLKAGLAVFMIDGLRGNRKLVEVFLELVEVDRMEFIMGYRNLFKNKYALLKGMGTSWEIANMPNL